MASPYARFPARKVQPMDQDPIAALAAEEDRLEEILSSLGPEEWEHASACEGWSVADVVLHLAQTEEAVRASVEGGEFAAPPVADAATIDDLMAGWVGAERGGSPSTVFERWRKARREALDALKAAPADQPVAWAAAPLRPKTLATTRLSEHWIHAMDIAGPLGKDLPDTDRLWHIARLAHRTVPYALSRAGRSDAPSVYVELEAPDGDGWTFGEPGAEVTITGKASEFCRVAARRLAPDATSLRARGEGAHEVLSLLRTYA
jgi:uncharacterized protein (TIGR03084 family)